MISGVLTSVWNWFAAEFVGCSINLGVVAVQTTAEKNQFVVVVPKDLQPCLEAVEGVTVCGFEKFLTVV